MLRIKDIVKEKGLTLEELAKRLSISRVTLSRNINGNPTVKTLEAVARELNVEVKDLFEYKDNSKETIYAKRDGQFIPIGKLNK